MDSIELYKKAKCIAALGNKISSKHVKIADIYTDLKELHEECIASDQAARLSPRDQNQD